MAKLKILNAVGQCFATLTGTTLMLLMCLPAVILIAGQRVEAQTSQV